MRNKVTKLIFTILLIIVSSAKVYAETFPYSDAIVENFAAAMTSEIGCGHPEDPNHFVYQLMWASILVNNHYYDHHHNNITAESLCTTIKKHYTPNGDYCNYTFAKFYVKRPSGKCPKTEQEEHAKAAARLVLAKSFNIPSNIVGASEESVVNRNGIVWFSFKTESWTDVGYYWYPNNQSLSKKDVYGNSIRTDVDFYKTLAVCLYNNKTLYYAYNKCPGDGSSTSGTLYTVYLYPNGGTGITEGQKFGYNGVTAFSEFPKVTRTNCTLEGWNVGSADGEKYYSNVDSTDNGKKLYARWNCSGSTNSGSSNSGSSSSSGTYTVTYKMNDGTDKTYKTQQVSANGKISFPTSPTRDGYRFAGWMTSKNALYNYSTPVTSNLTLYAKWEEKSSSSSGTSSTEQSNRTTESSTSTGQSSRTTQTTSQNTNNSEGITNPQTGASASLIALILIVVSFFGVTYYNKNYKISEDIYDNE